MTGEKVLQVQNLMKADLLDVVELRKAVVSKCQSHLINRTQRSVGDWKTTQKTANNKSHGQEASSEVSSSSTAEVSYTTSKFVKSNYLCRNELNLL